eukprot:6851552-Prymnesium_polylepis.2
MNTRRRARLGPGPGGRTTNAAPEPPVAVPQRALFFVCVGCHEALLSVCTPDPPHTAGAPR